MLRVWNVTLVIITFLLTIFQTFMTRSGDRPVGARVRRRPRARRGCSSSSWRSIATVQLRLGHLPAADAARRATSSNRGRRAKARSSPTTGSCCSRAFFILFATMFPTITEAINGERLTVGPPFFNKWMTPVGLMLLFADRHRAAAGVAQDHDRRTWCSSSCGRRRWRWWSAVGVVALGVRVWSSGICFALCGFVFGTISQEYCAARTSAQATSGADLLTAMIGLVGRNKRRYGGYIVHLGIVLMFLGFAGEGMSRDEQLLLKPGEEATVGDYTLHLDALRVTDDGQKQMVTAHITRARTRTGSDLGKMYPAKWYFRKHEDQPTTEVGDPPHVRRRPLHRDAGLRDAGSDRQRRGAHQPAGELDLVRVRHPRDRHRRSRCCRSARSVSRWRACRPKRPPRRCCAGVLLVAGLALAQHVENPRGGGFRSCRRRKLRATATKKLACWCGGCRSCRWASARAATART